MPSSPSSDSPCSSEGATAPPRGALEGVRVLDLTAIGMGPFATQWLGDMGADVIKVEFGDGDVFRHVTPQRHAGMSHCYLNFNRNKRSVVLDLKSDEGADTLRGLAAGADVFVSNMRPAALQRLQLSYDDLAVVNPRLVYCGCHGYGEGGPYAGRPSMDDIVQAISGMAALQGHSCDRPRYVSA